MLTVWPNLVCLPTSNDKLSSVIPEILCDTFKIFQIDDKNIYLKFRVLKWRHLQVITATSWKWIFSYFFRFPYKMNSYVRKRYGRSAPITTMTTQHQIYTRNKMAVKIWTQENSLWLYTGNINSYSVTTLTEQIVVENVCAYLVRKRETIQAPAHTIRMNWSVVTFWQDWLPRLMSICCSSLQ